MIIHSGSFLAGNKGQEQKTKKIMEFNLNSTEEWMDSMHLKLTSDKTEYIMFRSQQQLTKINLEPLRAGPNLIKLSNKVKYLDGLLDSTLSFDQHVSSKVQKAWAISLKSSPYADTSLRKFVLHSLCYAYHIWITQMQYCMAYQIKLLINSKGSKTCV